MFHYIIIFLFNIDRGNSKGFDLNRNFPDYFKQNTKRAQPETEAVKDWISKIQFLLSGSLHGGALVKKIIISLLSCFYHPDDIRKTVNRLLSMTIDIEFMTAVYPDFHLLYFYSPLLSL